MVLYQPHHLYQHSAGKNLVFISAQSNAKQCTAKQGLV